MSRMHKRRLTACCLFLLRSLEYRIHTLLIRRINVTHKRKWKVASATDDADVRGSLSLHQDTVQFPPTKRSWQVLLDTSNANISQSLSTILISTSSLFLFPSSGNITHIYIQTLRVKFEIWVEYTLSEKRGGHSKLRILYQKRIRTETSRTEKVLIL